MPPLVHNEPANFQAAGSLIVVVAILMLSRARAQYENTYRDWIKSRFSARLSKLDEQVRVIEERANFTANLHSLQIAQISDQMNFDHPWREVKKEKWEEIAENLNLQLDKNTPFPDLPRKISESENMELQFKDFEGEFLPWMTRVWRLEVVLLILGTLQWGYGDRFVRFLFVRVF